MPMTIEEVIEAIMEAIPGGALEDTVDTVKTGDPDQAVRGVVTTFLATQEVIERAVELDANLIITHEPTFYGHRDEVDWLEGDPIYQAKRALIDDNGIVVWRFHDYWHRHRPDGILTGVLESLGWSDYSDPEHPSLCIIPPLTLRELGLYLKKRLGTDGVRVIGDPHMICRRIGLAVGAGGGRGHIRFMRHANLDSLACGELNEWETAEYVRDAVHMGRRIGLIVVGHASSEEPGMAWLVNWLAARLPDVPVTHVPAGDPFHHM